MNVFLPMHARKASFCNESSIFVGFEVVLEPFNIASPIVRARVEFFDSPNAKGHCPFTWDPTLVASCEVLPRVDQDSNHSHKNSKSRA